MTFGSPGKAWTPTVSRRCSTELDWAGSVRRTTPAQGVVYRHDLYGPGDATSALNVPTNRLVGATASCAYGDEPMRELGESIVRMEGKELAEPADTTTGSTPRPFIAALLGTPPGTMFRA